MKLDTKASMVYLMQNVEIISGFKKMRFFYLHGMSTAVVKMSFKKLYFFFDMFIKSTLHRPFLLINLWLYVLEGTSIRESSFEPREDERICKRSVKLCISFLYPFCYLGRAGVIVDVCPVLYPARLVEKNGRHFGPTSDSFGC